MQYLEQLARLEGAAYKFGTAISFLVELETVLVSASLWHDGIIDLQVGFDFAHYLATDLGLERVTVRDLAPFHAHVGLHGP